MGTDRARCIRMPQFGQRRQISLAPAQRKETWCARCVFSLYNSSSTRRQVSVKADIVPVRYTDTETPKQNREIVSSRCATVTAQSFFGGGGGGCPVQPKTRPASGRFAQQLTVLGCCLHTKSDMKSNSFCPRKSSGSS